jgi:hypothetical protein
MCPACESKSLHAPEDWEHHPYRTHGFNGSVWTHPDLPGAATSRISGELNEEVGAPAGGGEKP